MMKQTHSNKKMATTFRLLLAMSIPVAISTPVGACTIFCTHDKYGNVWAGNNEDFYWFEFSTQIRIVPKTDTTLSYIYFNYPNHDFPQGGVNEAGLFFDANMVEASDLKNANKKINFPGGTLELIRYMLGHCKTVPEVLTLFETYKVLELTTGQLHLADKAGNMGIITADSAWLTTGHFQISTNYNLGHNDDDYKKCWRYPIAYSMLAHGEPDLELMNHICDSTSQRQHASTIYSNVHNLTTGEMWLYYAWDYQTPYKTTFKELTALGDTVILLRDLFADQIVVKAYNAFRTKGFQAGLNILNTVDHPSVREEKLKLLSQGVLFKFDTFIATGKIQITDDEQLIHEVIEATTDLNMISLIANQDLSKENKRLVEAKLKSLQRGANFYLIFGFTATAVLSLLLIIIIRNRRTVS